MFLANSLREKLKRSYLENDSDALDKPKFAYNEPSPNPKILLSFHPPESEGAEKFSTQKLQALDKKEWESKFSLGKLRKDWKTKIDLDFELKHKKFPDGALNQGAKESQSFVRNLVDPDVLELKQRFWNSSSETKEKQKPELQKTILEVSHGLKDFKVVPLKEHIVEEGVDSRNFIIVDGNTWDISNKVEEGDLRQININEKEKAKENSNRYWRENEYNRENGEPFPISEERKKVEIIRYFKKYRTPLQQTKDYYKTMEKVKELTNLEKQEIEKKVKYKNPGSQYQEKIDALVFKEMFNLYKYKYNELTGKLDKEEIKRIQREQNKFKWKDRDLTNKMIAINSMDDISWFKPEFLKDKRLCSSSQDRIRRALLKPLVINGNDIHLEEEKIKEKLAEDYKKQKKKEILLSQKMFKKCNRSAGFVSRYPLTREGLDELEEKRKNDNGEVGNKMQSSLPLINTLGNFNEEEYSNGCGPFFLQAYQKICSDKIENLNKMYRKNKDQITFECSHPGAYREFDFEEKSLETDPNNELIVKEVKKKVKRKLWSCCMNADENSKGCQKIPVKKFRWIYEP